MSMPYKETGLGNNHYIREFSPSVATHELQWHCDHEDRIVEIVENTDWRFQLDNQLPILLEKTIFIPKETYHRIIKGNNTLIVKITKL